ncbi:MAG: hypothetical protein ACJ72K_12975 [Friedmanniella sp.]
MTETKPVSCWLTDMDGVLVHEEQALPGGAEFVAALQEHRRPGQVDSHPGILAPGAGEQTGQRGKSSTRRIRGRPSLSV